MELLWWFVKRLSWYRIKNIWIYIDIKSCQITKLEKNLQLTDYQESIIDMVIEDLPFRFVDMENRTKSNPLFRFTLPLYSITWLILFCSMPFKYLITGDCYYSYSGKVIGFIESWKKKLNL